MTWDVEDPAWIFFFRTRYWETQRLWFRNTFLYSSVARAEVKDGRSYTSPSLRAFIKCTGVGWIRSEQYRQCACNVTSRAFVQPSLQWESNKLAASGIQHAMCMRHICHQWPVRLYTIFPHNLMNAAIFRGGGFIENEMRVLIFSTASDWYISRS